MEDLTNKVDWDKEPPELVFDCENCGEEICVSLEIPENMDIEDRDTGQGDQSFICQKCKKQYEITYNIINQEVYLV